MDMDTDTITPMKIEMIDIHNHLIYGVDDGSPELDTSIKMLENCFDQGIKTVFLTPHVNSSVSYSTREEHYDKFDELKRISNTYGINLFLGAEIYISYRMPDLDFSKYTMGNSNILLVEFSTINHTSISDIVFNLMKRKFRVIIAHIERYSYLDDEDILELKRIGAFIQINASTILKKGKSRSKNKCMRLIKSGLIDFVASDSHNITSRKNKMLEAYQLIKKKFSFDVADNLFNKNQSRIFFNK